MVYVAYADNAFVDCVKDLVPTVAKAVFYTVTDAPVYYVSNKDPSVIWMLLKGLEGFVVGGFFTLVTWKLKGILAGLVPPEKVKVTDNN